MVDVTSLVRPLIPKCSDITILNVQAAIYQLLGSKLEFTITELIDYCRVPRATVAPIVNALLHLGYLQPKPGHENRHRNRQLVMSQSYAKLILNHCSAQIHCHSCLIINKQVEAVETHNHVKYCAPCYSALLPCRECGDKFCACIICHPDADVFTLCLRCTTNFKRMGRVVSTSHEAHETPKVDEPNTSQAHGPHGTSDVNETVTYSLPHGSLKIKRPIRLERPSPY